MPKILFVYDIENEDLWKDGLSEAIKILEKKFDITRHNCASPELNLNFKNIDFILGWGGFNSRVDDVILRTTRHFPKIKKGLCLGGYGFPPQAYTTYDVYFYETPWSREWLDDLIHQLPNFGRIPEYVHAFGTNTKIYNRADSPKIWDYVSVGAFARWKRHEKIGIKEGTKLVVGEIQKNNLGESLDIISSLLPFNVAVSGSVPPETLAKIYRATKTVYIPAEIAGGGERALLEAKHCGCEVEIETDNPKLMSIFELDIDALDEYYYADQLEKGIKQCIS